MKPTHPAVLGLCVVLSSAPLSGLTCSNKPAEPKAVEVAAHVWYHQDALGTAEVLTDAKNDVAWHAAFSPYGRDEPAVESVPNAFRFPGQYEDAESSLYQNVHRYYDCGTGRYLKPDPKFHALGMRPRLMHPEDEAPSYQYAASRPTVFTDAFGLQSDVPEWFDDLTISDQGVEVARREASQLTSQGAGQFSSFRGKKGSDATRQEFERRMFHKNVVIRALQERFGGDWRRYWNELNPSSSMQETLENVDGLGRRILRRAGHVGLIFAVGNFVCTAIGQGPRAAMAAEADAIRAELEMHPVNVLMNALQHFRDPTHPLPEAFNPPSRLRHRRE